MSISLHINIITEMMTYNEAFVLASKPYIEKYPLAWDSDRFFAEFTKAAKDDTSLDDADIVIFDSMYDHSTESIFNLIKDHAARIVDIYNYGLSGVASGELQSIGIRHSAPAPMPITGATAYVSSVCALPIPNIPIAETIAPPPPATPVDNKPVKKIDPYARFK